MRSRRRRRILEGEVRRRARTGSGVGRLVVHLERRIDKSASVDESVMRSFASLSESESAPNEI
jgi:hypothetical protein